MICSITVYMSTYIHEELGSLAEMGRHEEKSPGISSFTQCMVDTDRVG